MSLECRRIWLCFFSFLGCTLSGTAAKPEIPKFATIAGIRVGVDTVSGLEKKIGAGDVTIGGHARSGRIWHSLQSGWDLWLDGFYDNARNEEVIDTVRLEASDGIDVVQTNLPREKMLFMGCVAFGMSRHEVLHAIGPRLAPPKVVAADRAAGGLAAADRLIWEESGYVTVNVQKNYRIKHWTATLGFQKDRLAWIFIEAGYAN